MEWLIACGIGFAAGLATRMGPDSLREHVIDLMVAGRRAVESARFRAVLGGEYFQDLMAEARERYQASISAAPVSEVRGAHSEQCSRQNQEAA